MGRTCLLVVLVNVLLMGLGQIVDQCHRRARRIVRILGEVAQHHEIVTPFDSLGDVAGLRSVGQERGLGYVAKAKYSRTRVASNL